MKSVIINEVPGISFESDMPNMGQIATESAWSDFKKFVGFDDESKTRKRIKDIRLVINDLHKIKTFISQAKSSETVKINILKAVKTLPVKGKTGAELAREMSSLRKRFQRLYDSSENVKTKEEYDAIKSKVQELSSQSHEVNKDLTVNKHDILSIIDECIAISELEVQIYEKGLKVKGSGVSTECYNNIVEAVALESFFNKLGAVLLAMIGIIAGIEAVAWAFVALLLAASGAWAFAVGVALGAWGWGIISSALLEEAERLWKE